MQMEHFAEVFGRVLGVSTKIAPPKANAAENFPDELREEFVDTVAYAEEIGYAAETVDKSVLQPDEVSAKAIRSLENTNEFSWVCL